jgi:NTP pyrophosphatase (non-canonical NTP hydrolase)
MTLDEYQNEALRTAANPTSSNTVDILIWTLGLTGEAGEVADYIKKVYGHRHPLDLMEVRKELGDVLWYVATLADAFGFSLADVARANVEKLRERYPNGFSVEASTGRKD